MTAEESRCLSALPAVAEKRLSYDLGRWRPAFPADMRRIGRASAAVALV